MWYWNYKINNIKNVVNSSIENCSPVAVQQGKNYIVDFSPRWRRFLFPVLTRMVSEHEAGKVEIARYGQGSVGWTFDLSTGLTLNWNTNLLFFPLIFYQFIHLLSELTFDLLTYVLGTLHFFSAVIWKFRALFRRLLLGFSLTSPLVL